MGSLRKRRRVAEARPIVCSEARAAGGSIRRRVRVPIEEDAMPKVEKLNSMGVGLQMISALCLSGVLRLWSGKDFCMLKSQVRNHAKVVYNSMTALLLS